MRPRELDGSLYYDQAANRAALIYIYQRQTVRSIYNFNDDQIVNIEGNECSVIQIPDSSSDSFFPFTIDKTTKKKIIGKAEDIFYFTNVALEKEALTAFPSFVYKSKRDFPLYGRENCDVMHIFSRPELESSTCDSISCQPTLISVSVKCPKKGENPETEHNYNYFRFKSQIVDEEVFQAPIGVHCPARNHQTIPDLPNYYSFSYDVNERQVYSNESAAIYSVHKKIWYDSQLKVIRLDEFDDDGLLTSSRVLDFLRGAAFTIIAVGVSKCEMGVIGGDVQWTKMARLPSLFFMDSASKESQAVYVGKRKIHGFEYEVWSSSYTEVETAALVVEEFYYTNNVATIFNENYKYLQISHVDVTVYERNEDTDVFELSVLSRLPINHFRSKPKEWEAYDVATCFTSSQKKYFSLSVKGPPVVKQSHLYEEILELLYMNLLRATRMSVVRISELSGVFDGVEIKEFAGWMLEKIPPKADFKIDEPDMETAYAAIQTAAASGTLSIAINKDGKTLKYTIKGTEDNNENITKEELPRPTFPTVFRVQMQGLFKSPDGDPASELEGSLFYDGVRNKAAIINIFQNQTTKIIYDFTGNEMLTIQGSKCTVSEISDDEISIFSFVKVGTAGQKTLAAPEEVFFFGNSKLNRQEISISPYYVYEGKVDFSQYDISNCDVSHVFTKPDVELPTCEGYTCKPTLVTISVICPATENTDQLEQVYNFFRFRSNVGDEVFQAPVGVHCPVKSRKPIPPFPGYFSFSYDLLKEQELSGSDSAVYALHKKIWYESKLNLIRMDEVDDDGLLTTTRIFDYFGETAYTIITSLEKCEISPSSTEESLDELTRLPKVFFYPAAEQVVYVGKRNARGLDYEVWSSFSSDDDSFTNTVEEIYFTKNIATKLNGKNQIYYQVSHVDIYTYVRNEDTKDFELSLLTQVSINNFRSKKKEWESFDVSLCFGKEERKGFRIKVQGPTIVKESHHYHDVLEHLLMELVNVSSINVLRINELQGFFDGAEITEFAGWILNKPSFEGAKPNSEADMNAAYEKIKSAVETGKVSIKVKVDNQNEIVYTLTSVEPIVGDTLVEGGKRPGYSGASMSGMGLACLGLGFIIGIVGYYVFLKKRRRKQQDLDAIFPSDGDL